MYSFGTYKISSTKSVYSPKRNTKNYEVVPFNTCPIYTFVIIPLKKDSFSIFNENFKLVSIMHSCDIRSARNGLLFVPSYNSVRFGRKSIIHSTTLTWHYSQDKLTEYNFLSLTPISLKTVKFFIC